MFLKVYLMIFPAKPKHTSCHKTIKISDKRHTCGRIKEFPEFSIIEITTRPTKASGGKVNMGRLCTLSVEKVEQVEKYWFAAVGYVAEVCCQR
jgi:hypothetical protein